jgi:hypothetical protein
VRLGFVSLDVTPPFRCVENGAVAGAQRSIPRTWIDLRFYPYLTHSGRWFVLARGLRIQLFARNALSKREATHTPNPLADNALATIWPIGVEGCRDRGCGVAATLPAHYAPLCRSHQWGSWVSVLPRITVASAA